MYAQLYFLPEYLTAHLQLTLLALLFSTTISITLGIVSTRVTWLEQPLLAVAGVVQTIPSLALLAIMVPILAALDLQSIGFFPAIIGLTLYGVFPVLRNTVTGIKEVDLSLKEASRGVGMTTFQQLTMVELPLAMPFIVSGIRTATVWVVGIATLSTPIGATSLGNYIFSGLQTRNYTSVLIGCVAAAILALFLDSLVRAIEVAIIRRRRGQLAVALVIVVMLYGYAGFTLAAPMIDDRQRPVIVGSKTFTEQYILSSVISLWIEHETGRSTSLIQSLGSIVAFDALAAGEIDVYVDYSGTLWANEMRRAHEKHVERVEVLDEVSRHLEKKHGITLAATLGFENAYALAVRAVDAERLDLHNVSDLIPHATRFVIGGDYEFFARPEWLEVKETYGLRFREQRTMDSALMYQAAATYAVDVISAFSSDGRIVAYGLQVLEDDRNVLPPYDAVILVSARLVNDDPAVVEALTRLDGVIDVDRMRAMNLRVDSYGHAPSTVASEFIEELLTTGSR